MLRRFLSVGRIRIPRFMVLAAVFSAAFLAASHSRAQQPVPVLVNFFDVGPSIGGGTGFTYIPTSGHYAIVTDSPDRVYIVDDRGRVLSQFDTPAGSLSPTGIAFIPPDRLAICDSQAREVFIVDLDGNFAAQFDTLVFGSNSPQGITYNPDTGNLALVDNSKDLIYIVNTNGVFVEEFSIAAAGATNAVGITHIAGTGNYAVVDASLQEVFIVNASGIKQAQFDTGFVTTVPRGIAYNPVQKTYEVLDDSSDEVFAINNEGVLFDQFSTLIPGSGNPTGITYNTETGNYVIVDEDEREIFFLSPEGDKVGQCDISAAATDPTGIAYLRSPGNYAGNYAVSDRTGDKISIVSPTCELLAQFDTTTFGINVASATGIAHFPGADKLVLSDNSKDAVFFFDTDLPGKIAGQFDTGMFQCTNPDDVAYIDDSGFFAVIDGPAAEVFVVDKNGVIKARFNTAPFSASPKGIAYNNKDKVFAIVDSASKTVYLVNMPALSAPLQPGICAGDLDGDGDVDGDDLAVFASEFGAVDCPY